MGRPATDGSFFFFLLFCVTQRRRKAPRRFAAWPTFFVPCRGDQPLRLRPPGEM